MFCVYWVGRAITADTIYMSKKTLTVKPFKPEDHL